MRGVPGEVIGPVHHIQPHEGGGEENATQHVDSLGARLVPGISWGNIYFSRKSTFDKRQICLKIVSSQKVGRSVVTSTPGTCMRVW